MDKSDDKILCHICQKDLNKKKSFTIYDYKFCSIKCTTVFRKQEEELKEKKQSEDYTRFGSFSFSSGGAGAC